MKILVADDRCRQARLAADIVEVLVRNKPDACLGLSTGSSPQDMYQELILRHREQGLDFSAISTINLDEYIGLDEAHPQSFRFYMENNFFSHVNVKPENTYVVKGVGDEAENISDFRRVLEEKPMDLLVLGVGADGHLGFNEPGDFLHDNAHAERLAEQTIRDNSRFFDNAERVPVSAYTMGMGDIMRAKKLLLIISGNKAEAARRLLLEETISPHCPVTFLKMHRDVTVIILEELARRIGIKSV